MYLYTHEKVLNFECEKIKVNKWSKEMKIIKSKERK